MRPIFTSLCATLAVLASLALATPDMAARAEEGAKIHRLALQISDSDKQKMNTVLNVAANVSRHYSARGEKVEIQVVAFNRGLHMLRDDTSPVKTRLQSFTESMPNVSFKACGNTHAAMTRKEGAPPKLFEFAEMVPAGVVRLMELDEQGWTIVRP